MPRKVWERRFLLGEVDPFMFTLARDLHMPLAAVTALPAHEVTAWRAFYAVEKAVGDLHAKSARARL